MTTTAVRERPIIFSAPMIRAILDGRKTQTRRAVKRPSGGLSTVAKFCVKGTAYPDLYAWVDGHPDDIETWGVVGEPMRCPYGEPGDRLWVRETWSPDHAAFYPHFPVVYRADGTVSDWQIEKGTVESPEAGGERFPFRWRSPIHMPRWASRITLEITGVRVERLNDISTNDAYAEGVRIGDKCSNSWECESDSSFGIGSFRDDLSKAAGGRPWKECWCLVPAYRALWESIHGEGSWARNEWVWAIEFKRVEDKP